MLQGFNYPLTPKGKSTLNPPPPWYYSADFLNIEFWADPSAVAATLPTELDPDLRRQATQTRSFTIGSSQARTKNTSILPDTSIVSSSFFLTHSLKEGRYPIVRTFSWTTMRR
jgi:hypothetical protein